MESTDREDAAMASYAFDGTGNGDKAGAEKDTNVVWFRDACQGTVCLSPGPKYDRVTNPFRIVRWNDPVHPLVSARGDADEYDNPPAGVAYIDDARHEVGRFAN
jgi:hypothetical protein